VLERGQCGEGKNSLSYVEDPLFNSYRVAEEKVELMAPSDGTSFFSGRSR